MKRTVILIGVLLLTTVVVEAKNVDLVTLPGRDSVQLTIYNSEDLTLAKETRYVTLKKGANKLQFSWANTLIDPSSVELRLLDHVDDVEIADTVFPGQKPQHLIWNIQSKFEGQVKMEVTYFTSGLTWSMDYVAISDPDETVLQFDGYVRVYNNSGEEYDNAEIRLIVGKINLVEKIADLARRQGIPMPAPSSGRFNKMKRGVASLSFEKAQAESERGGGAGGRADRAGIVKEGISEYFMFSVEGSETIPNGWSKRMQAVDTEDVKFDIVYRMRTHQYGPRPVRFFIWRNDTEHKLGDSPLPDGQVNLFRDNGDDGLSFLARQQIRYVPIKAEIEINLGPDDLVVYETNRANVKRFNFSFNRHNNVNGWDETAHWIDTIRNYRTKPITFELRRIWHGDIDYDSEIKTKLFDYRTPEVTLTVAARSKKQYPATVTQHHGANKKQDRVKLVHVPAARGGVGFAGGATACISVGVVAFGAIRRSDSGRSGERRRTSQ
ncbi:hypothetical protein LCGC14_0550790 [marine sediment metagenome]|uniref:DUF4139 domain-containing protein n=1 Tax=marine sediment metagenome TaxID=412755 RepID=A0A0F9UBD0_9ZZZZ|nr:hypothetical protein [Phycisphaerae bacterium]HDZ42599.1 hypothetical protein [Phycisphaerae bacterium]